jgi:osmotically-inducible protein OsmY
LAGTALAASLGSKAQWAFETPTPSNSNQECNMLKTDMQLKQEIEDELRWDPKVNAAQIGVAVDKGIVSLTGAVDTYAAKWAVEDATKRVHGVRTVAEELTVKVLSDHKRTDAEIGAAIESALLWHVEVPKTVTSTVQNGTVTLEGKVAWNFQRDSAERAVRYLTGVVAVRNSISIKPGASASQVKEKVQAALQRQATEDAKAINVDTSGGKVTLTGHASSWRSITDAETAAWSAPGVFEVVDKVTLSP